MPTYVKLPCTCGSRRYFEQQTNADGTTQPFCGDCRRLLDTYYESPKGSSLYGWIALWTVLGLSLCFLLWAIAL